MKKSAKKPAKNQAKNQAKTQAKRQPKPPREKMPLPASRRSLLIQIWLVRLFPVALFFSYHPVISLGSSETMNLELSLAEIWLVLYALYNLINLQSLRFFLDYYGKKLFAFAAFPAYCLLSALWSPNPLRAVLTAGLLALVVFDALNLFIILHYAPGVLKRHLQKIFLLAATVFAGFCWLQCILDLLGVGRDITLLCEGCTYSAFGFPHPNGFAIEPQFMGNLLLAPSLLAFYLFIARDERIFSRRFMTFLIVFLPATIFLTFSRGAIFAFLVGLAFLILTQFPVRKYIYKKSRATRLLPYTLLAFVLALLAQGTFAALSPTSDNFTDGIAKSLHQLSLGHLDLRSEELKNPSATTEVKSEDETEANSGDETETKTEAASSETSTFSGYVEVSTTTRTRLTDYALDIWNDSPVNVIFGTGLGSAGTVMYEKFPELGSPKEIVQNQYASLLLETGLVGFLLAAFTLLYIFSLVRPQIAPTTTVLASGVTLFFFAGLPNALHIYLFPLLLSNPEQE